MLEFRRPSFNVKHLLAIEDRPAKKQRVVVVESDQPIIALEDRPAKWQSVVAEPVAEPVVIIAPCAGACTH